MNFCSRQAKFSVGAVGPNVPTPFSTPPPPQPPLSIYAKHAEVSRNLAAGTRVNLRGWRSDSLETLLERPEPRLEVLGSRAAAAAQTVELKRADGTQREESWAPFGSLLELGEGGSLCVLWVGPSRPHTRGGGHLLKGRRGKEGAVRRDAPGATLALLMPYANVPSFRGREGNKNSILASRPI